MPKYYTPKTAIQFANSGSAALKSMVQTAEKTHQLTSDHVQTAQEFSGVIRYRRDFRKYLVSNLKMEEKIIMKWTAQDVVSTGGSFGLIPGDFGYPTIAPGGESLILVGKASRGDKFIVTLDMPAPDPSLIQLLLYKVNQFGGIYFGWNPTIYVPPGASYGELDISSQTFLATDFILSWGAYAISSVPTTIRTKVILTVLK